MKYREQERGKAVRARESIFRDTGNGIFFGKEWEFVHRDPALNLWEGIREDALRYFEKNEISWWLGNEDKPTGHVAVFADCMCKPSFLFETKERLSNCYIEKNRQ